MLLDTCIGYLDHPFEKEDSWAFTARIFLGIKWGLAIELAGEEFSSTRESTYVWATDHEHKACKSGRRGLPQTSSDMSSQQDGPCPSAGCSHMWFRFRPPNGSRGVNHP